MFNKLVVLWGACTIKSLSRVSFMASDSSRAMAATDLRRCGQPLAIESSSLLRQAVGCCISPSATPDPSVMNKLNQFPVGKLKAEA